MQDLIASKFSEIQDDQIFAHELSKILKEPRLAVLKSIVKTVPRAAVIEVLKNTVETQMNGGMPKSTDANEDQEMLSESIAITNTQNNSKNLKTAGGVFLTLLRKHPAFSKDTKKRIARLEKQRQREKRWNNSLLTSLNLDKNVEISVEGLDSKLDNLKSK